MDARLHIPMRDLPADATCSWFPKTGMALGTGSALAHRAVDSVLGSRHPEPAQAQAAAQQIAATPDEPCANFAKTFADCMSDSNGELEACRYYFDKLQVRRVMCHPCLR